MNKKVFLVMVISLLLIPFYNIRADKVDSSVSNYEILIEDDADLLTEPEEKKLQDKMESLAQYGNIILKTTNSNNMSTQSFAKEYYHNSFENSSGTLFLIDMNNRMIYIFSDGSNYNIITNAKANIITDNIYKYASRGDYYSCAYNAFDQINTLLSGGKISEPMRHISNALIAIFIAFLFNFILVLSKTKIKRASTNEVLKNCDISFNVSNIVGKKTGVDRVYSPVESSSGGSSGGGSHSSGGGGGHSSGGGGGHRF